jgi:hypothetical protein
MLAGLPKLFDRSFFIGFFLPSMFIFGGIASALLAFGFIKGNELADFMTKIDVSRAFISLVLVWLVSILLMAFNRPIIRLLEGYGEEANPFKILLPGQRQQFKTEAEPHLRKIESILDARRRGIPEMEELRVYDLWRATANFPEDVDLVLPTRLGNVIRAYERYSDVVYGIEAIVVWPRLFMIIPEQARERIREAEASFNFSINMLFAGSVTVVACGIMMAYGLYQEDIAKAVLTTNIFTLPIALILAVSGFFIWFSWWRLPDAARERGDQVKSIFDLYRKQLAEGLGLRLPATETEERKMWEFVSRRMSMRVADDRLQDYDRTIDYFRKKEETTAKSELSGAKSKPKDDAKEESSENDEDKSDEESEDSDKD